MATITPANLAYKDKDGDLGEVKSLTDTDVTLLNNALQDIEDLKLSLDISRAKTDLSNLTDAGKIAIAHNAMPSAVYDELTLGASGTDYTAPADGYFYMSGYSSMATQFILLLYNNRNYVAWSVAANGIISLILPVKKGDIVRADYSVPSTHVHVMFIYAVGSESEQ